jgi:hypothetical protein
LRLEVDSVDDATVRVGGLSRRSEAECSLDGITLAFEPSMSYGLLGPKGVRVTEMRDN